MATFIWTKARELSRRSRSGSGASGQDRTLSTRDRFGRSQRSRNLARPLVFTWHCRQMAEVETESPSPATPMLWHGVRPVVFRKTMTVVARIP